MSLSFIFMHRLLCHSPKRSSKYNKTMKIFAIISFHSFLTKIVVLNLWGIAELPNSEWLVGQKNNYSLKIKYITSKCWLTLQITTIYAIYMIKITKTTNVYGIVSHVWIKVTTLLGYKHRNEFISNISFSNSFIFVVRNNNN